jgi:hypothetical protein
VDCASPARYSSLHHLGQSRRVRACWDIGLLDIFAIYTEVMRARSGTTEVLYGEAEGSRQSIGMKTRRRRAEDANRSSRGLEDVRWSKFRLTSSLPLANVPNSVRSKGGDTMPLGVRDVLVHTGHFLRRTTSPKRARTRFATY